MTDRHFEALTRRLRAEPENMGLIIEHLLARARVGGSEVFLDLLNSAELWAEAHESLQDQAIDVVSDRLGDDFYWRDTRSYRCQELSHRIASFEHWPSGIVLHLLPGGEFTRGEADSGVCLEPAQRVRVRPFLMGRTVVTRGQWFTRDSAMTREPSDEQLPMCLGRREQSDEWLTGCGGGLRYPSEREWEYACRGGSETRYYWGDDMNSDHCWYGRRGRTPSVEEHWSQGYWNAFGLVDMSGLVWEWCERAESYGFENLRYGRGMEEEVSEVMVVRGGSCEDSAFKCRSATRYFLATDVSRMAVGLRVARSL